MNQNKIVNRLANLSFLLIFLFSSFATVQFLTLQNDFQNNTQIQDSEGVALDFLDQDSNNLSLATDKFPIVDNSSEIQESLNQNPEDQPDENLLANYNNKVMQENVIYDGPDVKTEISAINKSVKEAIYNYR